MPSIKLAHIREQGQNMLLFPLSSDFHHKTDGEQRQALLELERRAHGAGLAGRAVVFWEYGRRTRFLGPAPWRAFLQGLSIRQVQASLNREISW